MKKGFTLLELLIVIGIMAVLATAATIVLNPAQLLAQARDSQRISDMDALKAALALYLTDVAAPDLNGTLADAGCAASATTGSYVVVAPTTVSFMNRTANAVDADRTTDGAGWLPVNLSSISGGSSPLAVLPIDPVNSGNNVYRYACDQTAKTFELNACLESTKYLQRMADDGGDRPTVSATLTGCGTTVTTGFYEVGTVLTLQFVWQRQ